ncbi:MAG: RluA family pseudouridine synthase [Pseudomonadota bacterium]
MPPRVLTVSPQEGGQKLLQFLARRLDIPQSMFHRWIRTGQVRRNGARCKAFDRVQEGDEIRVPPFAEAIAQRDPNKGSAAPLPALLYKDENLFIFNKPAGLAVQAGTGHEDNLAKRLAIHCTTDTFRPTPAHRLDRDTSGIILVARSYAMLSQLHGAFREREGIVKEYLAWVSGAWPYDTPQTLEDKMAKVADARGYERMAVGQIEQGADASCTVTLLHRYPTRSLVLVRLHTGLTHQIRVQLSSRGFPLIGDMKYGGPALHQDAPHKTGTGMMLHAVRVRLPWGDVHTCLPDWTGTHALPQGCSLPPL